VVPAVGDVDEPVAIADRGRRPVEEGLIGAAVAMTRLW
jgi:hypothetical protein